MRELIITKLNRQASRYKVVGEAADCAGALEMCRNCRPELLILDINLPDGNGIEVVPQLKAASPTTRILLCTAYASDDRIFDALRSGAHGFVEKTNSWDEFVRAVAQVGEGKHYFSSAQSTALMDGNQEQPAGANVKRAATLSRREREVLIGIAEGSTSKEIAHTLGISVATVDTHRANLMMKLRIRNVAGLVVFALRAGLLKLEPDSE